MKYLPIGTVKPPRAHELDANLKEIIDPLAPPIAPKRGPGRPRKIVKRGPKPQPCPDLVEVRNAASLGMFRQDVAKLFGVGVSRWYDIEKRYPKLAEAYDLGLAEGRQRALRILNKKIVNEETGPLFFFLSRMCGYTERTVVEHENKHEEPVMSREHAVQVAQAFIDQVRTEAKKPSARAALDVREAEVIEAGPATTTKAVESVPVSPPPVSPPPVSSSVSDRVDGLTGVPAAESVPGLSPEQVRAMGLSRPEPAVSGGKILPDDEN